MTNLTPKSRAEVKHGVTGLTGEMALRSVARPPVRSTTATRRLRRMKLRLSESAFSLRKLRMRRTVSVRNKRIETKSTRLRTRSKLTSRTPLKRPERLTKNVLKPRN